MLISTTFFSQSVLAKEFGDITDPQCVLPELSEPEQLDELFARFVLLKDERCVDKMLDKLVEVTLDKAVNIDDLSFMAALYYREDNISSNPKVKQLSLKYYNKGDIMFKNFVLGSRILIDIGSHSAIPLFKQRVEKYLENPINEKLRKAINQQISLNLKESKSK
jgi:hypothetical protein